MLIKTELGTHTVISTKIHTMKLGSATPVRCHNLKTHCPHNHWDILDTNNE